MAKKYFVEDLHNSVGLFGETEFAVVKSEHRTTRDGKPFLDLVLRDRSGEVGAKVWSDMLPQVGEHTEGDVVHVEFEVREYRSKVELAVRKLSKATEFDTDDFIVNSYLVPVFTTINTRDVNLTVNYEGDISLFMILKNRIISLLWIGMKYIYRTKY